MRHINKALLLLFFSLINIGIVTSQVTPGLIINPANAPGNAVLDPDLDGYVSKKNNGIQIGFTNPPANDITQSEIPYVFIVRPDPRADLLRGGTSGATEIVGTDAAGNNAVMTYTDGVNLLYRFRIDSYSKATLSYSILIDTDGKFGFTGINADPNAVSGNPGFEIEVNLQSNFRVAVYKVDGTTTPQQVYVDNNLTHQQKALAYSTAGGDPDYFYDFYVPMSALTGITFSAPTTPTTITASTPMRYAAVTSMNPSPFIGNQAVSDVGGVTTNKSVDDILKEVIDSQTPTPPGTTSMQASACPTINDVAVSSTAITGTSTEASGTSILVQVYNGTNLVGSSTTPTSGSNWTINVSSLGLPGGVLVAGYTVKATATAVDKGASFGCLTKTVIACTEATATPLTGQITTIGGDKGFAVNLSTISAPIGTIVTLYKADYTLMTGLNVSNPFTTTSVGQTVNFQMANTGNSFADGTYYITYQVPGKCQSVYLTLCQYATAGTSAAPTITTTNISTTTTTIQGTGNAVPTGNVSSTSIIHIYADGVKIASTTIASGSTSFSVSVSGLQACQVITAKQITTGTTSNNKTNYYCLSVASNSVTVTRKAATPTIEPASCISSPYSINGRSTENGATVTLYDAATNNPISGGTATVSNGVWYMPNLSLSNNQGVYAKVTSGTCLTASDNSATTTVTTRPSASSYSIVINAPTIGDDVLTGTISGGSYPVTIKTYLNGALVGNGVTQSSAGTWTVSGVQNYLTINQIVKVTVTTDTGCESELSTAQAIVQCLEPPVPSYSGGGTVCKDQAGTVNLNSSETGRVYQLVNSSDVAVGPSAVGTGSPITLYTYGITSDLSGIRVKVYDVINPSCSKTGTNTVSFTVNNYVPTITFSSTALSIVQGQTSVNMAYTAKSSSPSADTYTIEYSMAAQNQGFQDRTTQNIPASPIQITVPSGAAVGTYSGTITIYSNEPGTCTTRQDFTITVYASTSTPVIGVQPAGKTICSGSTTTLSATASSSTAMTFTWQSSSSYNGTYSTVFTQSNVTTSSYTTGTLTATTYYRVLVSNTNGTTTSDVAIITVNSTPAVAGAISGPAKVSRGASFVNYSIPAVSGASNYIWHYSGTGVTILGNTNSVFLSFSANATSGNLTVQTSNDCGTTTAGTPFAITFDEICAWRSVKNGNWTDYTVWYKLDCSTGTWSPAATYPNNDRPIYVYDNVDINSGEYITADSVYIKPTGHLKVNTGATLTVTDQLILGVDKNGNGGQLNSSAECNNVSTAGAKVIVRKALDNTWDFFSLPYAVPASNVYLAGTNTNAVWGDIKPSATTNASFYIAQYDGATRQLNQSANAASSNYFINVNPKSIVPVRGYIISAGSAGADSIDFVAANGTQLTLCNGSYAPEHYLNPCGCNDGWVLAGTPYVSKFNLYYANPYKSYYVAPSYTAVASGADYTLNPFGAFFLQATASAPVTYNELGIANPSSHPSGAPRFTGLVELLVSNLTYTDQTLIRFGDNTSTAYVPGEDALKIQTIAAASPQIYTEANGACSGLVINSLPTGTERVDLKVRINRTGAYTIHISDLDKLNNIRNVTLVDTETGIQTDLTQTGYTFDATQTGISSRFYILLSPNISTDIDRSGNNNIEVAVKGKNISLSGLTENANVRLYDVVGKLMYQYSDLKNGQSFNAQIPGVYLMDINSGSQNVKVKILIKD